METVEEEREAPVPLVTLLNNILRSIFSNVEVYINNQQLYNFNGLYAHKSYLTSNFKKPSLKKGSFGLRRVRLWRFFE